MEKVGIFGGTFDPFHNEHLNICNIAIEELNLDKIIIVPTYLPPHKLDDVITNPEDRFIMARLCFDGNKKIEVSNYEISKKGKSFTIETVTYFKEKYPNAKLFYIVGGDMLIDFPSWKNPQGILEKVNLCAIGRESLLKSKAKTKADFKKLFNKNLILLKYTGKNVSSTKIRILSMFRQDISTLVPSVINKYIIENEIYQGGEFIERISRYLGKRLTHTAYVTAEAMLYAKVLNLDKKKVFLSASLHDIAKYKDVKDYPKFIPPQNVPDPVMHQFLGAYIAETEFDIHDEEVLDAIRYHSSGRANMTKLEKLIYGADMVEETRHFENVDKLRANLRRNFDDGFKEIAKSNYSYLKQCGKKDIYYLTKEMIKSL